MTWSGDGNGMGFPNVGAGGLTGFLSGGNTPQDWNQGIQNAPFTPYLTGPGTTPGQDPYTGARMQMGQQGQLYNEQGYNMTGYDAGGNAMTQAPLSMDFMTPGVLEQWQQQNQSQFLGPTASQQAYQGLNMPNLANGPGLDPYYDNAANRLSENVNREFAARGMYGSSGATNTLTEGLGNLAADQANREAQYALQRSGEQRAWEGLGGQMAGQADQSQMAQLMGGLQGASAAQQAARQRGQDFFGNLMGPSAMMAGMAGNTYGDMLGSDAQLMNNTLMMETGLAQQALQASLYNQQRQKDDATWARGMIGGGKGKGKGK